MMLTNIIEGLIFAAASGVTYESMKNFFGAEHSEAEIKQAIQEIKEKYSGESGVILIEYNNTYQFQTNPKYSDILADILVPIKQRQLSQTVLQTLAIIAYRQPITRSEIEEVRSGVSSDYAISVLMKAELIEIKGRKDTLGRPSLYGTTDNFLKRFQLRSLEDLPAYEELMQNIKDSGKFNQTSDNLYEIKSSGLYTGESEDAFFADSDESSEFDAAATALDDSPEFNDTTALDDPTENFSDTFPEE